MTNLTRREFAGAGAVVAAQSQRRDTNAAVAKFTARNILAQAFPAEKVAQALLPREKWRPYPTAADREAWESIPAASRQRYIEAGEQALKSEWPELSATRMLEYTRVGNRTRFDSANAARRSRLRALVMAETVEAKGRFVDEVVNAIWSICEQTFWGSPAHVHYQKAGAGLPDITDPTVDLFAGEAGAGLAWAVYYLGPQLDKVSPLIRERVHLEVDRRILTPCIDRDQHWMVRGMNWNPWCNSNWLIANLLLERNEKRRCAAVCKSMRSLDNFLNLYPDDGGCDEGPGYWGHAGGSLFDCLEMLRAATGGTVDIYKAPLVQEIGRYIYRAHIHGNWFINFADCSARLSPRGSLVYRFGRRIGDEKMAAFGAWAVKQRTGRSGDDLDILFGPDGKELSSAPAYQPLVRDVWLKDIQVMAARIKEGSSDGFYLAAQGGHNAESHNHNDVGNFVLFFNGEPLVIDVGPEAYSAKTFSKDRYSIWTMSSAYHNVPTVNGVAQRPGREAEATDVQYKTDDRGVEYALNLEKAYPAEAGLESWRRTIRLDRAGNTVEILDRHSLTKPVGEITLTLMTPCRVAVSGSELTFETAAGKVKMLLEGPDATASIEEIPIVDERLRGTWGESIRRILLRSAKPPARGEWRVKFSL